MRPRRLALLGLALASILLACGQRVLAAEADGTNAANQIEPLLYLLTWLLPLGITLVAVGLSAPERAQLAAVSLPLAMAATLLAYWLCGFALHFGGVGLVSDRAGYASLLAQWSPLDLSRGSGWGLMGLRGFALPAEVVTDDALMLFVSQLALVTTAALIPLLAGGDHLPTLPRLALSVLVAGFCFPLVGNWVRGGGWLSYLGLTLGLGHGYVDYGLSSYQLAGACAALAGLLAFRHHGPTGPRQDVPRLPAAYLPLNVLIGALFALLGWLVVVLYQPLVAAPESLPALMLKALMAVSAAVLANLFYGWLARGELDPGLAGRSIVAGLVAIGPALAFVSMGSALLIGAVAGTLLAPSMYLIEHLLGLDDRAAALSVHGIPALWGLLAVSLFADGTRGQDWNAFGGSLPGAPLNDSLSRGVAGLFPAAGLAGDIGQLYAQILGIGGIVLVAGILPWLLLTLFASAYELPESVRASLQARQERIRQRHVLEEIQRLQGHVQHWWQRLYAAYLHSTAASARLLKRRRSAASGNRPSAGGPDHS